MTRRIGILTGGGDAPGLNPAIKWAVRGAQAPTLVEERGEAYEVWGIRYGWKGLVAEEFQPGPQPPAEWVTPLNMKIVRTWDRDGGTHLSSSRTNPYHPEDDRSELLLKNIEALGLDALIVMGGEDTQQVAFRLHQEGVPVVGIPKTIDKDVLGTDYTLGFWSAVEENHRIINNLRNPAGSHEFIYLVETMGRHAGHLALESGKAAGAVMMLIPEYDFDLDHVCHLLVKRKEEGARYDIVVIAEGAKPGGNCEMTQDITRDDFGHVHLGGVGEFLGTEIHRRTGLETRSCRPGHIQRGPRPNFYDVIIGRHFGLAAVEMVTRRQFGRMVALCEGEVTSTPLEEVVGGLNLVDVGSQYDTEWLTALQKVFSKDGNPLVRMW
ncbi:MAG: 6-phosphofructokinase [Nitrospinota bacterium]